MTVALKKDRLGIGFDPQPLMSVSVGSSSAAETIRGTIEQIRKTALSPSRHVHSALRPVDASLNAAMTLTSQVSMHFGQERWEQLVAQINELLDGDDWDDDDQPVTAESYRTFLRTILLLKPTNLPMLGVEHRGHILAAWVNEENDRLTFECLPHDVIRWILSCTVDGDRESVAGEAVANRLPSVLAAYDPQRWFGHDRHTTST